MTRIDVRWSGTMRGYMRRLSLVLILVGTVAVPSSGWAGPWGALPEAVAHLQSAPGDHAAQAVLAEAEASIVKAADSGRLPAVAVLMETYVSLVMRLQDGEERVRRLERKTAAALIDWGDVRAGSDPVAAATAWTLAARYDDEGAATERLRRIVLPPTEPENGETWRAVLDRAELVYQPPLRVRIGCSENDRRCLDNEVFFRWIEIPGFWIEATEVTNDRYRLCVDAGRCSPPADSGAFTDRGRMSPLSEAEREDLKRWVTEGFDRRDRLIIILYYFEEMTMAEIGAVLDLSESRVSQIHKEILTRLRQRYAGSLCEELVA